MMENAADSEKAIRRAAVLLYTQTWLRFDGPERAAVRETGLDGAAVQRIAKEYLVARTIPGLPDRAKGIAGAVRQLANQMDPRCLTVTARSVAELAKQIKDETPLKRRASLPLSAVSKLLWFASDGRCWMIYDSYVRHAVAAGGKDAESRFIAFYEKVSPSFNAASSALLDRLQSFDFIPKHPERILDAWLLLKGAAPAWRSQALNNMQRFLELFPKSIANPIQAVANDVAASDDCWLKL